MNSVVRNNKSFLRKVVNLRYPGGLGSGAGKGGGGGGTIREAGGAFGKMEAARENKYFYKKQKKLLANLKCHLQNQIALHEKQIKLHEEAIKRHKDHMSDNMK